MVILIILSVIVIFFTILSARRKKQARKERIEERIKQNKIRAAEEEFLNLEKNVLCEDGITRVYRNYMYGLLKEEIINIKGCPEPSYALRYIDQERYNTKLMNVNQVLEFKNGFCEVKGKILHELTRHFNMRSISIAIDESSSNRIFEVNFIKSNWFSEEGKILSQTEIIDGADFYDQQIKSGVRTNPALAGPIIFHEINGHYFLSHILLTRSRLRPFSGLINNVKYINGEPIGDVHSDSSQRIKKDLGAKQYGSNDGLSQVLDSQNSDMTSLKGDVSGLQQYFEEMPTLEKIYNELTHAIRNGYSVEEYIKESNLMDSSVGIIVGKGFSTIAGFLSDMLNIQENEELRKDLEACKEAQKILLNLKED